MDVNNNNEIPQNPDISEITILLNNAKNTPRLKPALQTIIGGLMIRFVEGSKSRKVVEETVHNILDNPESYT